MKTFTVRTLMLVIFFGCVIVMWPVVIAEGIAEGLKHIADDFREGWKDVWE